MNAKWVLGADIVPPAKPAQRLSAHVPSPHENSFCLFIENGSSLSENGGSL